MSTIKLEGLNSVRALSAYFTCYHGWEYRGELCAVAKAEAAAQVAEAKAPAHPEEKASC